MKIKWLVAVLILAGIHVFLSLANKWMDNIPGFTVYSAGVIWGVVFFFSIGKLFQIYKEEKSEPKADKLIMEDDGL